MSGHKECANCLGTGYNSLKDTTPFDEDEHRREIARLVVEEPDRVHQCHVCEGSGVATQEMSDPETSVEHVRANFLREKADKLNLTYMAEGWGNVAWAIGVEPQDLESQARRVAMHCREDVYALGAMLVALNGGGSEEWLLGNLPAGHRRQFEAIKEKYRLNMPTPKEQS